MKKYKWVIGGIAIIVAIVAGLSTYNKMQDKPVIGIMLGTLETERWPTDVKYTQEALEKGGYRSVHAFVGENSATYIPALKRLIEKSNIKALIFVSSNLGNDGEVLEYARAQGIPVVGYDRIPKDAPIDYYVTYDTFAVGAQSAEETLKRKPNGAYMYIQGEPKDNNALVHRRGAFSVLDPKIADGSITMVKEFIGPGWHTTAIQEELDAYIKDHPEIVAIVTGYDGLAEGAIEILQKYNRTGVVIGGQDAELAAIKRIISGWQTYTIYKPLRQLGIEAARVAILLAEGKKPTPTTVVNNGAGDVPTTMLPVYTITKENIDDVISDGFYTREQVYE